MRIYLESLVHVGKQAATLVVEFNLIVTEGLAEGYLAWRKAGGDAEDVVAMVERFVVGTFDAAKGHAA